MLSRGLNGKETGEGTGICPRDVLCIDCVCVLNGSFSASSVIVILFSAFIVFAFLIYFIYLPFCFLHLLCLFSSILFSCCPYLSTYVYIHIHSLCI